MRVCRQCVPTFVSLNVSSVADLQTKNQFLAAEGRQYLTLKLNGEIFGFGIRCLTHSGSVLKLARIPEGFFLLFGFSP